MKSRVLSSILLLIAGCTPSDPQPPASPSDAGTDSGGGGSGSGGGGSGSGGGNSDGFFAIEVLMSEISVQRCRYASAGGVCDAMIECDGKPLPEGGFGDITLSDGATTVVMPFTDGDYPPATGSFPAGSTLATSAAAGWQTNLTIPTMDTGVTSPAKDTTHSVNDPLKVTWTPSEHTRVLLELTPSGPNAPGPRCYPDPSAGEFTFTPDLLQKVGPASGLYLCLTPIEVGAADEDGWHFETQVYGFGSCQQINLQ